MVMAEEKVQDDITNQSLWYVVHKTDSKTENGDGWRKGQDDITNQSLWYVIHETDSKTEKMVMA